MSAVFYHDEAQRQAAEKTRDRYVATPAAVRTEIVPHTRFWMAEDYHQKYYLRSARGLFAELRAIYPDERDFVASTAVARANGFLAGHTARAEIEAVVGDLGLSERAQTALITRGR